ncbi:MAG TPA: CDP-alcohol phosphatidyltransferase family protein [Ktedonobacteraceae bacterium]|nr:CDP-alcohol phosphatidyltransferase family protein [Ktedonobacteraceae bacterium]
MKQLKRRFGSIYSEDEARVLGPWQRIRQFALAPVAALLSRLGIGPNTLSYASVVFAIGFFFLASINFTIAFWLLVASIICDGLDGVEARLTGTNTPRGSFTDMFCDQAVVAFSVAGMVWRGSINPVLAILFVYLYTSLVIFLMLHQMLQVSSHWLVRPSRMVLFAGIALVYFFNINLLNILLATYLLAFPMLIISFWRLRKAL